MIELLSFGDITQKLSSSAKIVTKYNVYDLGEFILLHLRCHNLDDLILLSVKTDVDVFTYIQHILYT